MSRGDIQADVRNQDLSSHQSECSNQNVWPEHRGGDSKGLKEHAERVPADFPYRALKNAHSNKNLLGTRWGRCFRNVETRIFFSEQFCHTVIPSPRTCCLLPPLCTCAMHLMQSCTDELGVTLRNPSYFQMPFTAACA